MHSFGNRANALLTFALTILAILCGMASLSDNFNNPAPSAEVQILDVLSFKKTFNGKDWANFKLRISANLESLFTWNTKQVFVFLAAEYDTDKNSVNQISIWDHIISSKARAKFTIEKNSKYGFWDEGNDMRGKAFNMTLHWHVMPKTGKMFADKIVMSGFKLPGEYVVLNGSVFFTGKRYGGIAG